MALYIVATPIGNLKDITLRAIEVLRESDYIAAEDTRVTRKLLSHLGIQKPLISFHEHSKPRDSAKIIQFLESGRSLAYVVDAGTPGISDPGAYLVQRVAETLPGVAIIPIPGPSALSAALSVSGLGGSEFLFLGFPPHKKGRRKFFQKVAGSPYPVVLYESPYRLLRTLRDLASAGLESRPAILCKEISKIYEEILRGCVSELLEVMSRRGAPKGEYVIIINR